jgi:hypothetical protein
MVLKGKQANSPWKSGFPHMTRGWSNRSPDPKIRTYQVAEIAFAPDGLKGTENLLFNQAVWEIPGSEAFLGRWHRARIVYDMTRYSGSVWIDGGPVLAGVPLQPDLDVQDLASFLAGVCHTRS